MSPLVVSLPKGLSRHVSLQSTRLWLFAALLLSLLLRIPFLAIPLFSDEGGYAYVADQWLTGRGELYRDLMYDRPQGIFLVYGLIQHTLGHDVVAMRLGAWIAAALTMVILWSIARSSFGDRVAQLTVLIFAVVVGSPTIEGFTANGEVFMALPSAACIWLLLHASRREWASKLLFAAGSCAGTAVLIKQSGIVILPIGVAFVLIYGVAKSRRCAERIGYFVVGFCLTLIPAAIHGWSVGWSNYLTGIGGRINDQSGKSVGWQIQLHLIAKLVVDVWPYALVVAFIAYVGSRYGRRSLTTAHHGLTLPSKNWRWRAIGAGNEANTLLWLWLAGCTVGIAMGGMWFVHYLSQIVGPLAIWVALTAVRCGSTMSNRVRLGLAIPLAILLVCPYFVVAVDDANAERTTPTFFRRATESPQEQVAHYIQSRTRDNAAIYVAFYKASIYYLADRPSASKLLFHWELRSDPKAEANLVAMVESPDRPIYIVDLDQDVTFADNGATFWRAVNTYYDHETTIERITIYRAKDTAS